MRVELRGLRLGLVSYNLQCKQLHLVKKNRIMATSVQTNNGLTAAESEEIDLLVAQVATLNEEMPGVWRRALREALEAVLRNRRVDDKSVRYEAHCPECRAWTPDQNRVGRGCGFCGATMVAVRATGEPV